MAVAAHLAVRPRSLPVAALLALALLGAVLSTAIASVVAPNDVFGLAGPKVTACSGVNVRTSPSTTAPVRATLGSGAKVTVALTVKGARWTVSCGGTTSTSTSWYRISAIDGVSVASRYGVSYLYAAAGLFKPATTADAPATTLISTNAAICSANARTGPSTSRPNKVTLHVGTKVTVTTKVIGGVWRLSCGSRHMSSTWWYRISAINGRSVKSLYRVTYLYAAIGLFKSLPKPVVVPPKSGLTEGIDISHWQGTIDWAQVAAAGKKFAFMKASEDIDYVDKTYPANRAAANANGIIIGAYHFAQPDLSPGDAIAEADHFLDTAQIASGDLPPVLDLEVSGGLNQGQLQAWVRAYLGRIYERTGVRGVIYTSPAFWVKYAGDSTWFADNGYKVLWIAHWTTATAPTVPADAWGGNGWTFWQYTSSGSVSGISGRVDLDRFNGTDLSKVRIPYAGTRW